MSQNPHGPHSSEEKLSALEDDQESLDNSTRKRIQQSVPGSHRDDTPKCKQNCPLFKKKIKTKKKYNSVSSAVEMIMGFYSILCKFDCFAIKYCTTPDHLL